MHAYLVEVQGVLAADDAVSTAFPAHTEVSCAKSFLQSYPAGVYSCARVKAGAKVSSDVLSVIDDWSFHLQRLSDGLSTIACTLNEDTIVLDKLKRVTHLLATTVLAPWLALNPEDGMLTVLWYPLVNNTDCGVAMYICPMPTPKCLASTVLIYGNGRANARCKHTQWLQDRAPIETYAAQLAETRGESIHEVVLSKLGPGGDRWLLEGLVTNFFVVKGGMVYTANEDVLYGSTRQLVLQACADLGIPVMLEAPLLSERMMWEAAFVTSVVRVVVDVTRILLKRGRDGEEIVATSIPSETSDLTRRIRQQISHQRMQLESS